MTHELSHCSKCGKNGLMKTNLIDMLKCIFCFAIFRANDKEIKKNLPEDVNKASSD